jgi:hypothetical protein
MMNNARAKGAHLNVPNLYYKKPEKLQSGICPLRPSFIIRYSVFEIQCSRLADYSYLLFHWVGKLY